MNKMRSLKAMENECWEKFAMLEGIDLNEGKFFDDSIVKVIFDELFE